VGPAYSRSVPGPRRSPSVPAGRLSTGDVLSLAAARQQDSRTPDLEVLILGGQPIREPVVQYGPFVMNTKAEIMQAVEDYQAGRLGVIPAAHMPHTAPGDDAGPAGATTDEPR
jgi:hypothetical protein